MPERIYRLGLQPIDKTFRDKAYECVARYWGDDPIYRSDLNGLLRRMLGLSASEAAETTDDLVERGLLVEVEGG